MITKELKTRIVNKHDTEANWNLATNFIPLKGEFILYDPDANNENYRIKMENPGRVPGSKAIYYKEVDRKGNTIRVYKETYDPSGNLVHTKEK